MTRQSFGLPRIRPCDHCKAHVRCRGWDDRCSKCGEYVIHRMLLEVLDAGVRTEIVNGEKVIVVGPATEDPSPIR